MSYKLQDAAWLLGLPHTEKSVLGVLCKHAHDDGLNAWPSVETITNLSGLTRRTTQRALRSLMARNIIAAVNGVSGGRRTTRYTVLLPNADMLAAMAKTTNRASVTPLMQELQQPRQADAVDSNRATVSPQPRQADAPTAPQGRPYRATVTPESVIEPVRESVHQPTTAAVVELFQKHTGQVLEIPESRKAALMEKTAGYSLEEIDSAFYIARDQFDGFKTKRAMLTKLLDVIGGYLQESRRQAKERAEGEPTISPELEAQQLEAHKKFWNITLPELEQRLQEEVSTLEMFRGGFTDEMIQESERKIKSLTEDIEQEKAHQATRKKTA